MDSDSKQTDAGNPEAPLAYNGKLEGRMAPLGYHGAPNRHEMEQGDIVNLNVCGYVSIIHCKAGSRRSSHWHKQDEHYLYVLSGKMRYWQRPVDASIRPDRPMGVKEFGPGEQVHTPPMVEHWTEFPVDTVLVSTARHHRHHAAHEADLERVGWFE